MKHNQSYTHYKGSEVKTLGVILSESSFNENEQYTAVFQGRLVKCTCAGNIRYDHYCVLYEHDGEKWIRDLDEFYELVISDDQCTISARFVETEELSV